MQWSADNTIPAIQTKSLELRQLFAKVANASLDKGFSKEEAIFAGMGAVKIHERKNAPAKAKAPKVPSHVESLRSYTNPFEMVSKGVEPKDFVKSAVLGKSALPSNQERTLVNADFNTSNQLVLTFDTGEKITTKAPDIEQHVEQYLNITNAVISKRSQTIGDGTSLSFSITNIFGNIDLQVTVYSSEEIPPVVTDISISEETISVSFDRSPLADSGRIVIIG